MSIIFKCKMCGGDLSIQEDCPIAECEYCGTKQTVPVLDTEKKSNLFARANRLRFNNEFDKASGVFEGIAAEFPEEAEAYWGLCLCKYGIEYVDDPATARKVPTCHRTSFESIFDDSNFDLALEYADPAAQKLYREEAKEIDRLQRSILDIANKEKPFDIFICYKETAEDGQRTKDSVMAQDIYDALTEKGYKVFFARITLEDKLGQEYEPYIFAALNSARVMLSIGTKYEYFNAVWVKNEWSRFLEMKKQHHEKVLIPCYADIDAYDMPQEFRNLQGQDMGRVGFIQDLVRGIGKIIPKDNNQPVQRDTIQTSTSTDISNLINRMYIFLEDSDWESAINYCEKILDIDYQCADAYVGKLMADLGVNTRVQLAHSNIPFTENDNFIKALRFGNDNTKIELNTFAKMNADWIEQKKLDDMYTNAKRAMEKLKYDDALAIFKNITGYRDSITLAEHCNTKLIEINNDKLYNLALKKKKQDTIDSLSNAISKFEQLKSWKDSKTLADNCRARIIELQAQEETKRIEDKKIAIANYEKQANKRVFKKIIHILIAIIALLFFFAIFGDNK